MKDIPFYSLSFVIDAIFSELKEMDKLYINAKQLGILNYFLTRFPHMSDKPCTCDRIIPGFIDVGMLDTKQKFWPDFYAILKTKRRRIIRYEMQVIEKNVSQ